MPCSEVITIQLGPYSNYVGSFLWNLDYIHAFGRENKTKQVDLNDYEVRNPDDAEAEQDVEAADCGTFFRKRRVNRHGGVPYIPRAVFCDYAGGLPPSLHSTLATKVAEAAAASNKNLGQSWGGSWSVSAPAVEVEEEEKYHPAWYTQLQPALRPLALDSRLCCFLNTSKVSGETSAFAHGMTMANTLTDNGESYLDTVMEAVRWHAEEAAGVGGFRILCDADSAWAGFGSVLVTHLTQEYASAPVLTFAVSAPLEVGPSPTSPWPAMVTAFPHDPATPASMASLEGPLTGTLECKKGSLEIRTPAFLSLTSAQQAKKTHQTRATTLAMFLASVSEHDNVVTIPLTVPGQLDLFSRLMSSSLLSATKNASPKVKEMLQALATAFPAYSYAVITAPTIATLIHTVLSPIYTVGTSMHQSEFAAIQKPIPKLCIANIRGSTLKTDDHVIFGADKKEIADPFYTSKTSNALGMTSFSTLVEPASQIMQEYILETPENVNSSYALQKQKLEGRKFSSVCVLRGLDLLAKSEKEQDNLRLSFTRQCVENRGQYARNSISLAMNTPIILPSMTPFVNLDVHTQKEVRNTFLEVSMKNTTLCTAAEMYTGADLQYGISQLQYRLRDAKKNALFMHTYNENNFTREDIEEALDTLEVIYEEYSNE